jgi:hypothetical protein
LSISEWFPLCDPVDLLALSHLPGGPSWTQVPRVPRFYGVEPLVSGWGQRWPRSSYNQSSKAGEGTTSYEPGRENPVLWTERLGGWEHQKIANNWLCIDNSPCHKIIKAIQAQVRILKLMCTADDAQCHLPSACLLRVTHLNTIQISFGNAATCVYSFLLTQEENHYFEMVSSF